jgi:Uma2 family endonuclease
VVYMGSPVRITVHASPHGSIIGWLFNYRAATPGVMLADNATLRLDQDNEPQPDALLRLEPEQGGRSYVTEDGYLAGAPELIVEIAASSASYDLHEKKRVYRRNGVPEYIVWRIYDEAIDWFRLENEEYVKVEPDAEGVIESSVFPGLRLAVTALLTGDLPRVLAEVQKGLASPEHAAFVARLSSATSTVSPAS